MRKGRKPAWLLGFRLGLTTLANGTVNKTEKKNGVHRNMLYGYAAFPDLVILNQDLDLTNNNCEKPESGTTTYMYGCVEAKVLEEKLIPIPVGNNENTSFEYKDVILMRVNNKLKPDYYISFNERKPEPPKEKEKVEKFVKDCSDKYTDFSSNINILKSYSKLYGSPTIWECKGGNFTKKDREELKDKKLEDILDSEPERSLKARRELSVKMGDKTIDADEVNNDALRELFGELLWYGKVLYTNGIVWKYLEIHNSDKEKIRKKLSACVGKNGADWITTIVDTNVGKKEKLFPITVMCVEIGNLSDAYDNLVTSEDVKEEEKLGLNITSEWAKEWNRLKNNLAAIDWAGSNYYSKFWLKENVNENKTAKN